MKRITSSPPGSPSADDCSPNHRHGRSAPRPQFAIPAPPAMSTPSNCPTAKFRPPTPTATSSSAPPIPPAPEMTEHAGVPRGKVIEFTMSSADSKIYPGIARDADTFGTADPNDPAKLIVTTEPPRPLHAPGRRLRPHAIRRRRDRRRSSSAADGPDPLLFTRSTISIAAGPRPGDGRHLHRQRQRRRPGQPARAGVRHDVGPLRRIRRDRSPAAGRSEMQREANQGSQRPARRWAAAPARQRADHGVVPP